MRDEMLKRLDAAFHGGSFGILEMLETTWQAIRAELAAERCENCAHVTLAHDNGTTVFCAHPEMWNNRDRGFCCSHFTKKEPTP